MNTSRYMKSRGKARPWQWVGLCALFLLLVSTTFAQPPLFEPQEGYYKAKGTHVTAAPPKPELKLPPVRMTEPDQLFEITTGPDVLGREPFVPGAWAWLVLAAFGPLAAWMGFVIWRRIYPDSARQALIRRSRAAR